MPTISIVIPVYNVEKYLRQCLDSVVNQTFSDFECICVNDGSTDNSLSILQEYATKDKRFKIFSTENKGIYSTRNTGISHSIGEYITFIDSDDWLVSDYLEKLYANITINDDVVICSFKIYKTKDNLFKRDPNFETINKLYKKLLAQKNKYTENVFQFTNFTRAVWGKLYRSSVIKNNNIMFFDNIRSSVDYGFNIIFNMYAKNIVFITDELYIYRKQVSSITSNNEYLRIDAFYSFIELMKDLENRNFNSNAVKQVCIDNLLYRIGKISKNVSKQNRQEILQLINKILPDMSNNSKHIGFVYKFKLKLSIFIFRNFNLTGFKIFRILKNIIH
ncbi:MAG: glycosyltransferase family 2 protein [Endomicrobiaceae bacterium]|nr:glycosyltransferase family 2 protein [Endomicrobiaceae bacterium]